jgi:Mlc titration factor MtfA (ptsG expression regulator)
MAKGAEDELMAPDVAGDHGDENSAHERARKLEQINSEMRGLPAVQGREESHRSNRVVSAARCIP